MSEITIEKKTALDWISANTKRLIDLSDMIWDFAEPAYREFRSAKVHCNFLRDYDFEVKEGIADMPTAFLATYGSGKPIIATYAEYDAPAGNSQKPVPYREPIVPYAPGHDSHNLLGVCATGGIVAARMAMEKHQLKGTLKIFGTPAEKIISAKGFLARDRYFDDLDAVIGNHPSFYNTIEWDENKERPYMAVAFEFFGKLEYRGTPWLGKSALDAAALMMTSANYMKEHICPTAWGVHEILYVGGQSLTNLPEYTQLWYGFSAPTIAEIEKIRNMLKDCAEAACKVTKCTYKMRITGFCRSTLPNRSLQKLAYRNLELVGPPKFTEEEKEFARKIQKNCGLEPMDEPLDEGLTPPWELPKRPDYITGSDDSNEFSWYAPFCWIRVTCKLAPPRGREYLGKSQPVIWGEGALSRTGVGHKCVVVTAKTIASSMIELLTKSSELEKAKAEFHERIKEKGGREPCLIPTKEKPPIDLALPEFDGKQTIIRYPTTGKAPIYPL